MHLIEDLSETEVTVAEVMEEIDGVNKFYRMKRCSLESF